MEAILYAEVYLVCMVVLGIVTFFAVRDGGDSSSDRWFRAMLVVFMLNFAANFLFKLVNGGIIGDLGNHGLSYALKTLYHLTLCVGVFAWCGYADSERGPGVFQRRKSLLILLIPLALPLAMILLNGSNHLVFEISESGSYVRHALFQVEMGYLLFGSGILAVRLVAHARAESDPSKRAQMHLTATFPLCIALAWLLSWMGEAFPVICVAITAEVLCLYIGGARHEVSVDKLTQVNNRQNLVAFMDHKERNNNGNVYLMMIDVDEFKQINDNFGHIEGDVALVAVAGVLKRACGPFPKRPYIARYGGDEFIVIAEADGYDMAELAAAIDDELRKANAAPRAYALMLSVGVVHWDPGLDRKQVIDLADAEMYRVKRQRRREREAGRSAERAAGHVQLQPREGSGR